MIDARLQTLRVLHEQGTVTATAHVLHLTPSTVSQQLQHLAREVGVPLLEAEGRRVRLTAAAHTLLGHADTLFAQWERARADLAAHVDGTAGRVRIRAVSSAVAELVAPAVARLRAVDPDVDVHVSEEESDDCFPLLLSGRADLAVLIPTADSPPPTDERFDQRPLLDEPQDLLVPEGHPLAARAGADLAEAAHEDWIASPARADQYRLLLTSCTAAGFTPHVAHEAREWFAISALVAHGFGVCLIPRLAPVPPEHPVRRVRLRGPSRPSRRLVTAVRRGSRTHPSLARVLDTLHTVVRERVDD